MLFILFVLHQICDYKYSNDYHWKNVFCAVNVIPFIRSLALYLFHVAVTEFKGYEVFVTVM